MKTVFTYCTFLVLCYSCTLSETVNKIKNDDVSIWISNGNVLFSDSLITLNQNSDIEMKSKYKNFELSFECKTGQGTIGSVYFHIQDGNKTTGYEIMINNNIETNEWRKTGGLTGIRNFGKRTCDNGDWLSVNISVVGKQIRTFSNNIGIVDYTEPENPYRESAYIKRVLSEGNFVFECKSGDPLKLRNITVKSLPADTITDSYAQNEQKDDIIKLHQRNFPTIDYHIHAKGGLETDRAARIARKYGITYALAPNCGLDFPIKTDTQLLEWLSQNKHKPFLIPMQAEGREWTEMFSDEAISQFDYVFTDALTWADSKGRRLQLWIPENVFIDSEQQFMDELTDITYTIIETEPIDVLANPTFLPDALVMNYDKLWTEERMLRIIDAAVKHNIALELNNLNKIPSFKFVKLAKERGAKFTFGTNNASGEQLEKMEYLIDVIDQCGLTASDIFIPTSKNF